MTIENFLRSLVPGALLIAGAIVLHLFAPEHPAVALAARGYPWATLIAAALLAARFQRSRVVAAAAAMGLCALVTRPWPQFTEAAADAGAVVLLSLVLSVLALTDDRGVFTRAALAQIGGVLLAAAAGVLALRTWPERATGALTEPFVDPWLTSWTALPQPALVAAVLAGAAILALGAWRIRTADAGLFWAFVGTVFAAGVSSTTNGPGLFTLAAGLVLVVSTVEASFALAYRDDLTGLPSRRALRSLLRGLREPYAVAIVDVDHFKSFNDRFGHEVGDQVLRMVASHLAHVTGGGRTFRSGGEEFTIVFPGKGRDEARAHVEVLRERIAAAEFRVRARGRPRRRPDPEKRKQLAKRPRKGLRVTVSVGVAEHGRRTADAEQVVNAADAAMYQAKRGGRNRVVAG